MLVVNAATPPPVVVVVAAVITHSFHVVCFYQVKMNYIDFHYLFNHFIYFSAAWLK